MRPPASQVEGPRQSWAGLTARSSSPTIPTSTSGERVWPFLIDDDGLPGEGDVRSGSPLPARARLAPVGRRCASRRASMKPDHVGREDLSSAALAHDRARRYHVNGSSGLGPATDRRPATIVGGGIAGEEAGGTAVTEAATGESLARCLRELVQHTAVYGLGPVLGQVAAVLLLPLYTNLLLPADYGTLEIIVLVGVFMNVFVGLQTATQVLRSYHACECEHDRREAISTAIIVTGVLTAAAVVPADVFRHRLSSIIFGTGAHAPLL